MCIFSTMLGLECFLPIFVGYNSPATICILQLPRKFSPICSKFHGIHYTYINVCGCNFWQMLEAVLHTDLKRNLWGEAKTVHKYWNEKMACFMWSGFFFWHVITVVRVGVHSNLALRCHLLPPIDTTLFTLIIVIGSTESVAIACDEYTN